MKNASEATLAKNAGRAVQRPKPGLVRVAEADHPERETRSPSRTRTARGEEREGDTKPERPAEGRFEKRREREIHER
jgi:hypothetical protein